MKNTIEIRISALVLTFISLFFLPWWLYVPILLAYAVVYNPALEVIAFGFLTDQIYGVSYTYTLLSTFLFISIYFIRSRIRV
jgi:hypothetical protein